MGHEPARACRALCEPEPSTSVPPLIRLPPFVSPLTGRSGRQGDEGAAQTVDLRHLWIVQDTTCFSDPELPEEIDRLRRIPA